MGRVVEQRSMKRATIETKSAKQRKTEKQNWTQEIYPTTDALMAALAEGHPRENLPMVHGYILYLLTRDRAQRIQMAAILQERLRRGERTEDPDREEELQEMLIFSSNAQAVRCFLRALRTLNDADAGKRCRA